MQDKLLAMLSRNKHEVKFPLSLCTSHAQAGLTPIAYKAETKTHRRAVADKHPSCGAVPDVPYPYGAVTGACGNVVAVGVPCHHIHI